MRMKKKKGLWIRCNKPVLSENNLTIPIRIAGTTKTKIRQKMKKTLFQLFLLVIARRKDLKIALGLILGNENCAIYIFMIFYSRFDEFFGGVGLGQKKILFYFIFCPRRRKKKPSKQALFIYFQNFILASFFQTIRMKKVLISTSSNPSSAKTTSAQNHASQSNSSGTSATATVTKVKVLIDLVLPEADKIGYLTKLGAFPFSFNELMETKSDLSSCARRERLRICIYIWNNERKKYPIE